MKYFNLITGDMFTLADDIDKAVEPYCLRLESFPSKNCKKCYGRFYISYNKTRKIYNICPKCTRKCIRYNLEDIKIETPIQTPEIIFNKS